MRSSVVAAYHYVGGGCFDDGVAYHYRLDCGDAHANLLWSVTAQHFSDNDKSQCSGDTLLQSGSLVRFCATAECTLNSLTDQPYYVDQTCVPEWDPHLFDGGLTLLYYLDDFCTDEWFYFEYYAGGCVEVLEVDMQRYRISCDNATGVATIDYDCDDTRCSTCRSHETLPLNACHDGVVAHCAATPLAAVTASCLLLLALALAFTLM
eukprot:TRINITY_DN2759_c0_g2_i6.p1 TRINITY_DN2759_c0_g2~~TRINITY_DN2759_c0_g2_i6.p1  ORF type:complete len:207 (+),score=72.80 TRINITY_DN2759_c0_g2_i6:63-683(+)